MARTPSTMRELGSPMPPFKLLDTVSGREIASSVLSQDKPVVVAFICNHCPFVVHIRQGLVAFGDFCKQHGVPFVAISSNDAESYPQDGPSEMKADAEKHGFGFPYLYDESQRVAREFDAACTPDFFVFDAQRRLAYRGQFDAARPGNGIPVTGEDLRAAVSALLAGKQPDPNQVPSIGCNIKWKQ